jgi:glycosyltransferase involved in cell wall biosynthesis
MADPLVSVHMITYNHAQFIAQAIEGVLKQKKNFPIELVIGDDCSTDGTREIVFEYQKKYPDIIWVVFSDKNVGAKENFYRTMKACRGKFIAFCEGDDYWHKADKLQKQLDYMESHPECGLVYSSYDVYHVRLNKKIRDFIKYRKWLIPENWDILTFVEGKGGRSLAILTCTVLVRRNLVEQIIESDPYLHKSKEFFMGDTQLWAEMITLAPLKYIPESLATHNITDESATRSKDIKKILRFTISGVELSLYLCDKYNLPVKLKIEREAFRYNCLLRLAFYTRSSELADQVRKHKKNLSLKEWFRYYGAKHLSVYYIYFIAEKLKNVFKKEDNLWL